ncbi:uncharacterized protein LOC101860891 [Aplysia californica]|uniref:Uncharacterized protein LOC101860891 n=1 Tax=Aplysia californica TaxID=6500 RepID=A0ABM0JMQ4_APLCA|nr:uncharacterized protein LOC101860891 [Aplysia californica]
MATSFHRYRKSYLILIRDLYSYVVKGVKAQKLVPSTATENTMNKLVVVLGVLVAGYMVLEEGFAIQCFVCNSFHQADCADWFDNVTQHLVKCPDFQTKCRKVVQEVWLEDHWDVRYIRQCAQEGEIGRREGRECQEIYGTYNIRVRHCHCNNQDGCNNAHKPTSHLSYALPVLLTVLLMISRQVG